MEFLTKLVETESSKINKDKWSENSPFPYEEFGSRKFIGLQITNDVILSIQASFAHYCEPRLTIDKDKYTSMEIAIIKNGDFVSVTDVTENNILNEKFAKYYDGTVYGYVPIVLIEELYQELKLLNYRKRLF